MKRPIMRFAFGFSLALAGPLFSSALDQLRGDQVGWARLVTSSPHWMRHSKSDPLLMRFFRDNTTLNIDPSWHSANVENLEEMCAYPFLFSQGIHTVESRNGRRNVAEYLRRGGFLLIDACINGGVTPSPNGFFADQLRILKDALPGVRVVLLPNSHPIYRAFFPIEGGPPHTNMDAQWAQLGLYAIEYEGRLVGIISFSGLQCGWDGMREQPGYEVVPMRMLVNIYVYAMLQNY